MVLRAFFSLIIALGFPPLAYNLLSAEGPLALILVFCSLILLLAILERWKPYPILKYLRWIISGVYFLIILLDLIIVPLSAYQAWFFLVSKLEMNGGISFAFTMFSSFLIVQSSIFILDSHYAKSIMAMIASLGTMVFILFQSTEFFIIFFLSIAIFLYNTKPFHPNKIQLLPLVILTLVGLIFSFLIYLGDSEPDGSDFISNLAASTRQSILDLFPGFPLLYNVPGYGYGFSNSDPAESPALSSNTIFIIDGEPGDVVYLRSEVFSSFIQGQWFPFEERGVPDLEQISNDDIGTGRYTLTLAADFYNSIPHTLRTREFLYDREFFSLDSEKYATIIPSFPLTRGDSITLFESDGSIPALDDLEPWLEVPDSLSRQLEQLVQQLKTDDRWETLKNIGEYLKSNYTYSLDTEGSTDFVLDFVNETKKGFCVHFASTFVILARMAGIPSRYVTGFLIYIPSWNEDFFQGNRSDLLAGRISVSGLSAHSWPEVYLDGRGWVKFEATPPMIDLSDDIIDYELDAEHSFTLNQLSAITGIDYQGDSDSYGLPWLQIIYVLVALTSISIVVFIIKIITGKVLFASLGKPLEKIIRLTEKQNQIGRPIEIGWIRWIEKASEHTPQFELHWKAFEPLVLRALYHGQRQKYHRYFETFYHRLKKHMKGL